MAFYGWGKNHAMLPQLDPEKDGFALVPLATSLELPARSKPQATFPFLWDNMARGTMARTHKET